MADATKRMSYFDRQFLRAADFQDEQAYALDRHRRHNRLLHAPGVAEGLQVSGAAGDASVSVSAGTAYDALGQEIVLSGAQQVDVSGISGAAATAFITVKYGEQGTDPSTDPGVTGTSTRISEIPGLSASATPPANPNINIVLATVPLSNGKLSGSPDNTVRTAAGTTLPTDLALRSLVLDSDTVPSNQWPKLVCNKANSAAVQNASMEITSGNLLVDAGRIGVGIASPDRNLTLQGGAGTYLNVRDQGDAGGPYEVLLGADTNGGIVSTMTNHDLQLRSGSNVTNVIIKANGNVGMGTTTPRSDLELQGGTAAGIGPVITMTNSGGGGGASCALDFNTFPPVATGTYNPSSRIMAVDDGGFTNDIRFLVNKTGAANNSLVERMRITPIGAIAVDVADRVRVRQGSGGTAGMWFFQTAPNGDRAFVGMATDNQVGFWGNTGVGWGLVMDTTTGNTGIGIGVGAPAAKLDVGGAVHATSFPASSDKRFKTNIKPLSNVLAKVGNMRGVTFEWNKLYQSLGRSTGRREVGVIAQEVEPNFPELVTTWDEEGHKAVDYGRLSAVLLEAVKELKAQNDELRARVEKCEQKAGIVTKKARTSSDKNAGNGS